MKKTILNLVVIALMALVVTPVLELNAQSKMTKQLQKARDKQFKEKLAFYEKEGWVVDGTAKTLKVAMLEHYTKLEASPNSREVVGSVSGCGSRNVCQQNAMNNAIVKYAQEAKSFVKGRVLAEVGNVGGTELDGFYSGYERLVAAEIDGQLVASLSILKERKDGKYEYDIYYVIDEESASKKRIKAMENAAKESAAAQKYARQISDFVNEAFGDVK